MLILSTYIFAGPLDIYKAMISGFRDGEDDINYEPVKTSNDEMKISNDV